MTTEEFLSAPRHKGYLLCDWVRSLAVNVPTMLPDGMSRAKTASNRCAVIKDIARRLGLVVQTRTFDGQVWAMRTPGAYPKEQP